MNDEKYIASQLKSLILEYQKELLEFYERRTLLAPEHTPVNSAVQDSKELKKDVLKTDPVAKMTKSTPRVEPTMPYTADDELDECSPPPSMLRPRETKPAPRIEPKTPRAADYEDECSPPPSILRPRETKSAPRVEPKTPRAADYEDECSPPPSMLRPRETKPAPRIEPTMPYAADYEDECSPPPSMLRPHETKTRPALCTETAKLHHGMECASVQVHVTSSGQTLPVAGARVTIFYLGKSNKKMRNDDVTDNDGNTQVFSIPISIPPAPCTIEVSASGFCSARYVGIALYSGILATQQIDLIELPPGHKSNLLILYDKLPTL